MEKQKALKAEAAAAKLLASEEGGAEQTATKSKKKRDKFLARKGYRCKGVLGVGTHVHTAHPDVYHFSHECPPISAILSSLHRSSMLFIKLSFLATILR